MDKKNLWLVAIAFLVALVLIFIGNIIVIGDHLATIPYFGWTSYVFYGLIVVLFVYAFILPAIKLHFAPEIPSLKLDKDENIDSLKKFAVALANNCSYIPSAKKRQTHSSELRKRISLTGNDRAKLCQVIEQEIETRIQGNEALDVPGINKRIDLRAEQVMIATAISQSSKVDSLIMLANNYKMVSDIVSASGFRPNNRQLIRLYYNVIAAALFSYALSDGLSDMDDVHPFDFGQCDDVDPSDLGGSDGEDGSFLVALLRKIRIPGIAVGSLLDGATNALLTYRIGFITRAYIIEGHKGFVGSKNKTRIRRKAVKEAFKKLPSAIKNCSLQMGGMMANAASKL